MMMVEDGIRPAECSGNTILWPFLKARVFDGHFVREDNVGGWMTRKESPLLKYAGKHILRLQYVACMTIRRSFCAGRDAGGLMMTTMEGKRPNKTPWEILSFGYISWKTMRRSFCARGYVGYYIMTVEEGKRPAKNKQYQVSFPYSILNARVFEGNFVQVDTLPIIG